MATAPGHIQIVSGEIAKVQADVLVNTTGTDVNLLAGTVSYTFLEAGGKRLQEELTRACPSGLKVGGIAQTTGGKLQCQKVFHVVLRQWMNKNDAAESILKNVVTQCLQKASEEGFKSIAFPALGSGFHRFPGNRSADIMITAADMFLKTGSSLTSVTIVLHPSNDILRKEFEARSNRCQVTHANTLLKEVALASKTRDTKSLTIRFILGFPAQTKIVEAHVSKIEEQSDSSTNAVIDSLIRTFVCSFLWSAFMPAISFTMSHSHSGSLFAGYPVETSTLVTGEKEALEGSEVKYFDLTNSPINGKTPEYNHYREVESQFFSFLSKDNVNRHTFSLTKVEYVVNPILFKRFRAAQRQMAKKQSGFEKPVLGFHGTEEDSIISICNEGFRQPDHPDFEEVTDVGWYGNGIYFSKYPRFSMNYMKRSCKLLLCKVLQGKIFKCEKMKLGAPKEPGYDSHVDPFNKEIVIYEKDCILPCYIVHFDISGRFKFPDDGASPHDDDHTLSQYMKEMGMHKGEKFPGF
ncbi:uncharacterized protein [Haliotis cracherodii]|uniref:uncharacterized protein n=1 Tax=Haliotis cracherodii TaxID=6455 RepID=UPI0039E92144